jgi:arylsulfatase
MVDRLDLGVGRLVEALKKQESFDNTLILFLADNGGCAEEFGSTGDPRPTREEAAKIKPLGRDELQTAMRPPITRDGELVKSGHGVMPGPADTYVAYGKPWANASNTPFRLYKHWNHEGGISTPLIAHWPQGIQRKGELEKQAGHLIDLMATCIDVSNGKYPETFGGETIQPMEGRSLRPAFAGQAIQREALYWEHEGNRAIRVGDWKLVANGPAGKWELYDLKTDRTELNDLAEQQPDRVQELAAKWEAYAQRANVYPLVPYFKKQQDAAKQ